MKEGDKAARLAALLAGLGIGAIVSLLAAPSSGEETRLRIAEKTNQGKDYVKQKAGQLARQVEDSVQDARDAVQVGRAFIESKSVKLAPDERIGSPSGPTENHRPISRRDLLRSQQSKWHAPPQFQKDPAPWAGISRF
jgi:hypothetical protein